MECAIFCVDAGEQASDFEGVQIFESRQKNSRDFKVFREIHYATQTFMPDLVHAWLPASITVPAMSVAAWKQIPSIVSYRNEQRFRRAVHLAEYLAACFLAHGVASNTAIERSSWPYRSLYRRKRGCLIRNAVHLPHEPAEGNDDRPTLPNPDKPITLLYVGRLTKQKNWQCLIRALPLIAPQYDLRLTVCGDGEDENDLISLIAELGISDRVDILGYRADVYDIMKQANWLVMPSWYEGMPNVLMEALAMGLPCLASDIPAVRDVIDGQRCVLTFDPHSPENLAALIDRALNNADMLETLRNNGLTLSKSFSVEHMAQQYAQYYKEVVANG